MDFFSFLEAPLPQQAVFCFFSEEALLRSLVYQKIRKGLPSGGEFYFHAIEEDKALSALAQQLCQGGLFTQQQVHCLFFGSDVLFSSARRKALKPLQACAGQHGVFWVGACPFNKLWQKVLPATMELISSPLMGGSEELKRLHVWIEALLPHPVSWPVWELAWQRTGGMLTESYTEALKQTLLETFPLPSETPEVKKQKIDLFNYIKKFIQPRPSLAELIEESLTHLSITSEWYPCLGLLHRQALLKKGEPRDALETIAQVDHWVKHFIPVSEAHHLTPFSIALLHKAFRMGSIRG